MDKKEYREYIKSKIEKINKPSWDDIYMSVAREISKKSPDAQTKIGAVIVNKDNEIVNTGYNGFIRGDNDDILPNLRPEKYPFMIHAEHNAILNCARQGKSTKECVVYVTAVPCNTCLMYCIQAGISEIVFGNKLVNMLKVDENFKLMQELILDACQHSIKLKEYNYE